MPKKQSNTPIIAVVALCLLLIVGFNVMAQNNNPEYLERLEKEKAAKEAEEAAKKAQNSPQEATPPKGGDKLVDFGEETVLNQKGEGAEIVVGWEWTPAVQGNPASVYSSIEQLQKVAGRNPIRIVNRDARPDVPAGISVNGNVVIAAQPDGAIPLAGPAVGKLMETVSKAKTP